MAETRFIAPGNRFIASPQRHHAAACPCLSARKSPVFMRVWRGLKICALYFKICLTYFELCQTYFLFAPKGVLILHTKVFVFRTPKRQCQSLYKTHRRDKSRPRKDGGDCPAAAHFPRATTPRSPRGAYNRQDTRKKCRPPGGSAAHLNIIMYYLGYFTHAPSAHLRSGVRRLSVPSGFSALRIMPWLSMPRSLRGGRLAMKHTCLPTSSSGL